MPRGRKRAVDEQAGYVQETLSPSDGELSEAPEGDTDAEGTSLAEGQIYDLISRAPVADTPIERTFQAVTRSLVEEYGFSLDQLRRDQSFSYEQVDEHGRLRRVRQRLSIVVYPTTGPRDNPLRAIRVCLVQPPTTKANDERRGVRLLEDVLGAIPDCLYGLWTNGTDLAFKYKLAGEGRLQPEYEDLYDLPGANESFEDLNRPDRRTGRIATGDNLQRTFARVHDYIFGNQGLKKDATFFQVLNLIFCKIHDERSPGRRFWVAGTERNTDEGCAAIAQRIKALFEEVKAHPTYKAVFSESDRIMLNDRVLAFAVGELSRYNLLDTDVDVKGAAYEEITASTLKSQRGQFFTPTNVIRLMIEMMDPGGDADLTDEKNWPRILDPSCGSGRFLTYALDYLRRKLADQQFPEAHPALRLRLLEKREDLRQVLQRYAAASLYGIDFDPDLQRAARMNMILNNDGHGNVLTFNSLEFPTMIRGRSTAELRAQYGSLVSLDVPDEARLFQIPGGPFDIFDYVFTNPPFGAKIPIDDPKVLREFELARRWAKDDQGRWYPTAQFQSRMAPEVLFVERCVKWVKEGTGRVAIVLPDGILGNPDAEYIRAWILHHCQVLASVDLPVEAFLPQVGVQASLLFLRRKSKKEIDSERLGAAPDESVFMAVAEQVGHDRRGNPVYVRDPDGAEIIFPKTRAIVRERDGELAVEELTVQERELDDDLARIGAVYQAFLRDGHIPE